MAALIVNTGDVCRFASVKQGSSNVNVLRNVALFFERTVDLDSVASVLPIGGQTRTTVDRNRRQLPTDARVALLTVTNAKFTDMGNR